jgi:UDP-N-acetylglucosamine:LPS N-acetylglucosamine transferase
MVTLGRAAKVAWRERPDTVVTTGSMPLLLLCVWARLFGARIVWIDSISQMRSLSFSGRVALRLAQLVLVQWPDLADADDRCEYAGQLL